MPLFCPKCGNKLQGNFKFCPTCGKNLKGKFTFCTECGKKIPISKKAKTSGISFPKLSLNIPRKTIIAIVVIICIAAVGATAVYIMNPFEPSDIQSAGRTFAVTVENNFGDVAECYLKVGLLKYGETFEILSGQTETINVDEDTLVASLISNNYNITLYVEVWDNVTSYYITEWASADPVTESAEFLISKNAINYDLQVECTDYQ